MNSLASLGVASLVLEIVSLYRSDRSDLTTGIKVAQCLHSYDRVHGTSNTEIWSTGVSKAHGLVL